jgi:hypothetical protein
MPLKKTKTCGSYPDNLAPIEIFQRHETAILGILPNGKPRAGRTPNVDYFLVGPVAIRQPFEEIEDQCVDDCVDHGLFPLPFCNDSPLPAKLHAGWRAGSDEVRPWMGRTAARPKNGRPLQNLLATK